MIRAEPSHVDILILGAGWTSTFLLPLLQSLSIPHAATTTTGRDHTIPFKFDPGSSDSHPYKRLPAARTVLITFPLTGANQSKHLSSLYTDAHGPAAFIQLGSTGIFTAPHWNDASSPHDTTNARAIAEDELLAVANSCVLNLAGLYGGSRDPKNWISRVAKSKDDVKGKKALHLIHGTDVARAIVAVHRNWDGVKGRRWLLTDLHVYDWWDLFASWGADQEAQAQLLGGVAGNLEEETARDHMPLVRWVGELMEEEGIRALPRSNETLGRVLDSRSFWKTVKVWPSVGRVR